MKECNNTCLNLYHALRVPNLPICWGNCMYSGDHTLRRHTGSARLEGKAAKRRRLCGQWCMNKTFTYKWILSSAVFKSALFLLLFVYSLHVSLINWGRVTRVFVSKLSHHWMPLRCQVITQWGLLVIWLGTNLSEICIIIWIFAFCECFRKCLQVAIVSWFQCVNPPSVRVDISSKGSGRRKYLSISYIKYRLGWSRSVKETQDAPFMSFKFYQLHLR